MVTERPLARALGRIQRDVPGARLRFRTRGSRRSRGVAPPAVDAAQWVDRDMCMVFSLRAAVYDAGKASSSARKRAAPNLAMGQLAHNPSGH